MSELKKGDKVRVEFEGTVVNVHSDWPDTWNVLVEAPGGIGTYVRSEHVTLSEPAEPEYETCALYIDAKGKVFARTDTGWRFVNGTIRLSHGYPKRPLRKLVPEA